MRFQSDLSCIEVRGKFSTNHFRLHSTSPRESQSSTTTVRSENGNENYLETGKKLLPDFALFLSNDDAKMATPGGVEFGKVRAPLDQHAVDSYLSQHIPGFKTPSDIKQFSFGQSCVAPTLFARRTDGCAVGIQLIS